ncbi:PP2C family protein-serine/threonine phosphatase [Frigidibacter sp. ROC022]|uniref:PP2C family protein-serine/threonine phosphatase n=1 Tax=Frigidibacter sp. ROC022 TaxID=2971796 RepID=UPI00215A9192|nr:protein phosphatase 2C domain-containing protein [Frigidibacter sp. ROC022]MCR8725025.1 protein phosphatase 2C domain-containing protein [Frigidibacter sp. ROC022]
MQSQARTGFDIASAVWLGKRETQEDALAIDAPLGSDIGLVVLADGMGGHAAGDVASTIVVTEVFADLKLRSAGFAESPETLTDTLRNAADAANRCVAAHVAANPGTEGMGATLVALVAQGNALHWISVGDSPLFLWRDGKLTQLNEDHSLAPQIDYMVESGQMDAEVGATHPDRNCLTSVLMGREVDRTDCPDTAFALRPDDIIVVASDGLQFLSNDAISALLAELGPMSSADIASVLLEAVQALADPHQDNVSFAVLQSRAGAVRRAHAPRRRLGRRKAARGKAGQEAKGLLATMAESPGTAADAPAAMKSTTRWSGLTALTRRLRSGDNTREALE